MSLLDILDAKFRQLPVVSILRGVTPDTVEQTAGALVAGGIRFIEVTLNSPDAIKSIEILSNIYGDGDEVFIGAGTVTTPAEVLAVKKAGGKYIISPNTNLDVIRQTKEASLVSMPGFYTPSEAFAAIDAGADYLKCFPCRNLGVSYIKDIKAVLTKPIIAVGGVDLNNIAEFLEVCVGVGIGSNLYSPKKSIDELQAAAVAYAKQASAK